jgi:tRNA threonylcarbamoyladenosine biosynthesis protein TsaE
VKFRKSGENFQTAEVLSKSAEETQRIGLELARDLPIPGVVMLRGALGTGKTTLTRGIAQGLGLEDPTLVHSPSFTLVNIYRGTCPIYHVDLYRLHGDRDLFSVGLDDFLGKEGVTIIEWSERLPYALDRAVEVELQDAGGDRRMLLVFLPWPERCSPNLARKSKLKSRGRVKSQPRTCRDLRRFR